MNFFDLHCDTALNICVENQSIKTNDFAVSLDKRNGLKKWCQIFAVWIPDSIRGGDAYKYYLNVYEYLKSQIEQNSTQITFWNSPKQISESDRRCQAILAVEGGAVLSGKLETLDVLKEHGVKLITLTWNGENELGYGANENKGLKPFGREVVLRMEELGIITDVSHLSEAGFCDVSEISQKPFVASHSNARAVCDHVRNLRDYQIQEIVKRNGLIGLNFYYKFISDKNDHKDGLKRLLEHIDYFMSLGADDVLCLGSDFDGCETIKDLESLRDMYKLYDFMLQSNYSEETVDKIFYKNASLFFLGSQKNKEIEPVI